MFQVRLRAFSSSAERFMIGGGAVLEDPGNCCFSLPGMFGFCLFFPPALAFLLVTDPTSWATGRLRTKIRQSGHSFSGTVLALS